MFTPLHSFLGGTLLFLASRQYYAQLGRTFGCSSILTNSVLHPTVARDNLQLHALFGLVLGSLYFATLGKHLIVIEQSGLNAKGSVNDLVRISIAGLLVGMGTRMANGCTSGHMLNGVARLSKRSLVATCCFFASAVATVYILQTAPEAPPSYPLYTVDPRDLDQCESLLITWATLFATGWLAPCAVTAGLVSKDRMRPLVAINAGILFAAGLCVSGMAQSAKTLGFLNFPRIQSFDPSLFMIVLGGLLPNALVFALHDRALKVPHLDEKMHLASSARIDMKLTSGSILFGIGWGMSGICPGPAVVNIIMQQSTNIAVFVTNLLLGAATATMLL